MEYHTKSGKKNPSPILTKKHLVQTDIFSNMIKYMIMNGSMEKKLNDKVVIPEKYKKMTQDELHAEIRRLEEKNGLKPSYPAKTPAGFSLKPSGAV